MRVLNGNGVIDDAGIREFMAERERKREALNRRTAGQVEGRSWYRIENAAGDDGDTAEIWLYDEISWLGITARDFIGELREIKANNILLHLNSPGGDVFDGLAIMSSLKNHPAKVTAQIEGIAASSATVVAMGADRIVMARHAMMMIHETSGVTVGGASDHRKTAEILNKFDDDLAAIYKERAGGRLDWRAKMREETWFTDEEAVKAGLADEVMKATPAVTNTFDLSIYAHVPEQLGGTAQAVPASAEPLPTMPNVTINFNSTLTPEQARQLVNVAPPEPAPNPEPNPAEPSEPAEPAATSQEPSEATDQEPVLTLADAQLLTQAAEMIAAG